MTTAVRAAKLNKRSANGNSYRVSSQWRIQGSNPSCGQRFFSPTKQPMVPAQPPAQWVLEALSPGIQWPGWEANHSPSPDAYPHAFIACSGKMFTFITPLWNKGFNSCLIRTVCVPHSNRELVLRALTAENRFIKLHYTDNSTRMWKFRTGS